MLDTNEDWRNDRIDHETRCEVCVRLNGYEGAKLAKFYVSIGGISTQYCDEHKPNGLDLKPTNY